MISEYDKRTMLGAQRTFPELIKEDSIISGSVAKDACAQVSQDLVKIVPQLDDFACPSCTDLVYHPIKLRCGHFLCIECASSMQLRNMDLCPICRGPGILMADAGKDDLKLAFWLSR